MFAANIFTNADKNERTCETITKANAVEFNTCKHFISVLSCFGPDVLSNGGWDLKMKYCAFKSGTILKALKAGQQPPRGNPDDPNNTGEREIPQPKAPEPLPEIQEESKASDIP